MGQIDRLALITTVRRMARLKWLKIELNDAGVPYYGASHIGRTRPWGNGCCICTGEGMVALFYGGRFITGGGITDPKRDQEKYLHYAKLLLNKDSREFILKCMRMGRVPGEGIQTVINKEKERAWQTRAANPSAEL